MTRLWNTADDFPEEAREGFLLAHRRHVRGVYGGCVRAARTPEKKVAFVAGGGTGHYPAFAGWVGPGMADGAVMGNIFASPSGAQAVSVAKACERGGGVIIAFGNYAGDVLQFGQAAEMLKAEGIDARTMVITDDIASASPDEMPKRRGIAGDFPVFKIAGAAAERGMDIDEVERVFRAANDRTRTLGVAFDGCTLPGADDALFHVPDGQMGIGLGIHGEAGIDEIPIGTTDEIAQILVERLLPEAPQGAGNRVVALVNGLGSTKYEEMFALYRTIHRLLGEAGLEVVDVEVDEQVTSLDMAGVSLTLTWVDEELESLWFDPVDTPSFRRGSMGDVELREDADALTMDKAPETVTEAGSADSQKVASGIATGLAAITSLLRDNEDELARLDTVAGDGDHGIGMVRGAENATKEAEGLVGQQAGAGSLLVGAGKTWSATAGGTSGALWGTLLAALGNALGDQDVPDAPAVARAVRAGLDALQASGGAQVGDKTMIDALAPFADALDAAVGEGTDLGAAWTRASEVASTAAENTAELRPRLGRARPLAERSVGHPDPGATSLAMIIAKVGELLR